MARRDRDDDLHSGQGRVRRGRAGDRPTSRTVAEAAAEDGSIRLIDVAAARRAGVSPLPAVNERADGVVEVIEYRPGGAAPAVIEVTADDDVPRERHVDTHPARYRTWKSSLFSLNATNALLNLGSNARVQPLVLPPEGLGRPRGQAQPGRAFSLHSGVGRPGGWRGSRRRNRRPVLESEDAADDRDRPVRPAQRSTAVHPADRPGRRGDRRPCHATHLRATSCGRWPTPPRPRARSAG